MRRRSLSPEQILAGLDLQGIQLRLAELERERSALRVLLRAVRTRERSRACQLSSAPHQKGGRDGH